MSESRLLILLFVILGLAAFGYIWSAIYFMLLGFDYNLAMPWSAIEVYARFGSEAIYQEKFIISLLVTAAIFIGATVFWFTSGKKKYFGDARWATRSEIKKAHLFEDKGILLGKIGNIYIRNNEPIHTLIAAPTRSGKGVGVVTPNLLSWTDSAIVLDVKQENFDNTSGFRGLHQDIYLFSPMNIDKKSHRWNPLDTIRSDEFFRIGDIQRLANIIVTSGNNGDAPMWVEEARDLFVGLVLYVLDTDDIPPTLGEIYRTLKTEHDMADVLKEILKAGKDSLDPACIMSFNNFINKAPKEQSGVKSSLSSTLNLWSNKAIDAATSASDFRVEDIKKKQITIYFAVTLDQLDFLSRLIRLFFELSLDVMIRNTPKEDEPYNVLMMIDEFGALGKMPVIIKGLPFVAGYNIRIVNVIQGLGQIDELYGKSARENILQNSAIQIFFAANDDVTAEYVSRRLGDKTIQVESISYGQGTLLGTKSQSYAKTNFMKPEEFRIFSKKDGIIFKENSRPIEVNKIIYYGDTDFTERLRPPMDAPQLKIKDMTLPTFDIISDEKNRTDSEAKQKEQKFKDVAGDIEI